MYWIFALIICLTYFTTVIFNLVFNFINLNILNGLTEDFGDPDWPGDTALGIFFTFFLGLVLGLLWPLVVFLLIITAIAFIIKKLIKNVRESKI